jgi:hypothetical protein
MGGVGSIQPHGRSAYARSRLQIGQSAQNASDKWLQASGASGAVPRLARRGEPIAHGPASIDQMA